MGTRLSRPMHANPLGKCTEELSALAYAAVKSRSEYIRGVLQLHVHGHGAVLHARMAGAE